MRRGALVPAGASLHERLLAEIRECDLVPLLWSAEAAQSDYVKQEFGVALGSTWPVLPVVLEYGVPLPSFISDIRYLNARSTRLSGSSQFSNA